MNDAIEKMESMMTPESIARSNEIYEPTLAEHMRRIAKITTVKKSDAARKNLERANEALRVKREKEKKE